MGDKIDLNRASDGELMNIRGIRDAVAYQIVIYRREKGSIRTWDELEGLPGFSHTVLNTLKNAASLGDS